jgi:four helix bundle protein
VAVEGNNEGGADIRERAFKFAVRIVKLCQYLEGTPGASRMMAKQLLRAGTSIGANLEEAQGGQSKADFISKNAIALKEARETCYWLKLLVAAEVTRETRIADLQKEVEELMRIIGAIIVAAKKSQT